MGYVILLLLALVGVALLLMVVSRIGTWYVGRATTIMEKWAKAKGLRIVEKEHRLLRLGPFWWLKSCGLAVYYVTVEDAEGHQRKAYLRLGSFLRGLWSDKVSVKWDE